MNTSGAIFLSASVPDPKRTPDYAKSADTVAIASAVSALVHVVLGRRRLVWGGHPAITPMVYSVAEDLNVDYSEWVTLYQSSFFDDLYPEDNERFRNIIYTERKDDREASLLQMRHQMLGDNNFTAGVFIGGMRGIVDEFHLFRELQPKATLVPVASTGGAVLEVMSEFASPTEDLVNDLDYVALFHRHLRISTAERRYSRPAEQPKNPNDRVFKPQEGGPRRGSG